MWSIYEELRGKDTKATAGLISEEDERDMGLGQVTQSIATLSVYVFKTKIQNNKGSCSDLTNLGGRYTGIDFIKL